MVSTLSNILESLFLFVPLWLVIFVCRKLDLKCWTRKEKKYPETKVTSK